MEVISLAEAPLATPLTLAAVPAEHAWRLGRLGLRPGAAFSVIRSSAGGGRIVAIAGSRVALGAALLRGVRAAQAAGFERIKLNAVILKNRNHDEVVDLARFAIDSGLDISFIEEMPLGVIGDHDRAEAVAVIRAFLDRVGIHTCGRYGEWNHSWTDESFQSGERAAEAALAADPRTITARPAARR